MDIKWNGPSPGLDLHSTTQSALTLYLSQFVFQTYVTFIFLFKGRVNFNSSERLGTIVIQQRRKKRLISVAQHYTSLNRLIFFPNQSKPEILFKGQC